MNNVVLITIDCLRPDRLGLSNNNKNISPFIDKMGYSGIYIPNGITNGIGTAASVPALLTSRFPFEDGGYERIKSTTLKKIRLIFRGKI